MSVCADLQVALAARTAEMLAFTEELVSIEAGSYDAVQVARVGEILANRWKRLGFTEKCHPLEGRGPQRSFHLKGEGTAKVVLLGHADTVWPACSQPGWGFTRDSEFAYGPGVGDMKGGLAMAWFAVDALIKDKSVLPRELVMVLVPDEEIGSVGSRAWIEDCVRDADAVLVLEPARPGGGVVIGRRAVGAIKVRYTGRSAHAALNAAEGASALRAACKAVLLLEALTDPERQVVVNVGILNSGTARQVVPHEAEMHVDLRAAHQEDLAKLETSVRSIIGETGDPRVTVATEGGWSRPLFPESAGRMLFALARGFAGDIGAQIDAMVSSGGSDGSFAGALGRPTLDGLGPICLDTCSRRERILIASLAERGAILGALIHSLARRNHPPDA